MALIQLGEYSFEEEHLGKINVILGKNGCGKSTFLKNYQYHFRNNNIYNRYISPERGGNLKHNPGIENGIINNSDYIFHERNKNFVSDYRSQVVFSYKNLELKILRAFEKNTNNPDFNDTLDDINSLLDNIKLKREGHSFKIYNIKTKLEIPEDKISSGEAELITLAIDCLEFEASVKEQGLNTGILLLDEPDVHLHPDLQSRLIHLLIKIVSRTPAIKIILATHSTPILSTLCENNSISADIKICFMNNNTIRALEFIQLNERVRKLLPIFGAHPLTNIFNNAPPLLVEGDDDFYIWQQAIKSSEGRIKVYPCECGGNGQREMSEYEINADSLLPSVYDNVKCYSLRDGDNGNYIGQNSELTYVKQFWLNCYAVENLLLSDDILQLHKLDWEQTKQKIIDWTNSHPSHKKYNDIKAFIEGDDMQKLQPFDRRRSKIKEITNIIIGDILEATKPWFIIVGQAIGRLYYDNINVSNVKEHSIVDYIGADFIKIVLQNHKYEDKDSNMEPEEENILKNLQSIEV